MSVKHDLLIATFPGSTWESFAIESARKANPVEFGKWLSNGSCFDEAYQDLAGQTGGNGLILAASVTEELLMSAAKQPALRVVVFAENPFDAMSRAANRDDLSRFASLWIKAAASVITAGRATMPEIHVLMEPECFQLPQKLADFLSDLHPTLDLGSLPTGPSGSDPLRQALVRAESGRDHRLQSLADELEAISFLLGDKDTMVADHGSTPIHGHAWSRWEVLQKSAAEAKNLKNDNDLLLEQLHQVQEELEEKSDVLSQLTTSQNETKQALESLKGASNEYAESKEENDLLLLQLHHVQEELEEKILAHRNTQNSLSSQIAQLKKEIDETREKKSDVLSQLTTSQNETKQALESLKGAINEHTESKEENDLLLLQLHQVQEELEHYFLENRKLSTHAVHKALSLGHPVLAAAAVRIGASGGADAHRHIDFHLDEASLAERRLGGLDLRLVEHCGRPGLLIFSQRNPPLQHWVANGEEDGKPYMLIVPQEKAGCEYLKAATTSDLFFLQGATNLLTNALQNSEQNQETWRWLRVGEAFLDRCREVPNRLHYDDVQPRPEGTDSFHFLVIGAYVSGRYLPEFCFDWRGHSLALALTSSHQPPMTCWPLDHDGRPVREVIFDLSRNISKSAAIPPAAAFTATDKLFLWQLVDELPNFIEHISLKNPDLEFPKHRLLRTAKRMRRNARTLAIS